MAKLSQQKHLKISITVLFAASQRSTHAQQVHHGVRSKGLDTLELIKCEIYNTTHLHFPNHNTTLVQVPEQELNNFSWRSYHTHVYKHHAPATPLSYILSVIQTAIFQASYSNTHQSPVTDTYVHAKKRYKNHKSYNMIRCHQCQIVCVICR